MKVLFIGGTGVISEAVSPLAIEKGFELTLLNRGTRSDFVPAGARVITADIRDISAVAQALGNETFDVVVDWISYVPDHLKPNLEFFKGRTKQYIFISSASAYQKPLNHYIITESTPLANPYWQYSRDKIACENLLMDAYRNDGFPITIVRPSYTYGKTIPASLVSWVHSWTIVDRMRKGKPIIVHGDGTSIYTLTHNTDFAKGFTGLFGHPQSIGEAIHITSDEVLDWNQIHQEIGRAAGVEPNIVHIPSDYVAKHSPDDGANLYGDKSSSFILDNSKIKRLVPGFHATVPFHVGIKRAIDWFDANPEKKTIDHNWSDNIDRIIHAYLLK